MQTNLLFLFFNDYLENLLLENTMRIDLRKNRKQDRRQKMNQHWRQMKI